MSRIVFLLEERSMKELLDGLLPRLFPGLPFLCVPHEGKQDLEKSIDIKLRAFQVLLEGISRLQTQLDSEEVGRQGEDG